MKSWVLQMRNMLTRSSVRQYFRDGKIEIETLNIIILRAVCNVTAMLTLIFILITPAVVPNWEISRFHVILFGCMVGFSILTELLIRYRRRLRYKWIGKLYCRSFVIVFMSLIIVLDTVPYPGSSQTFFAIFMVMIPVLFIVSPAEMLLCQILMMVGFELMNFHFKDQSIIPKDSFTAMVAFGSSIVSYVVVLNIRLHDFRQKRSYRLSSERDSLTGIDNRATCQNNIERYLSEKTGSYVCAMIVLDVDNFKQVNDQLGHEKGDEVLCDIAEILTSTFGQNDIVGRFGGDEFIIFMKNLQGEELIREKCHLVNERVATIMDGSFQISCSMGVCVLNSQEAMFEDMFRVADEALYEVKAFGKGTFVLHEFEQMEKNMEERPIMVIIDDNLIDRETMSIQFEENYQLKKFERSYEAMEYIDHHAKEISVILLDMIMPEMNGFEILKRIKSDPMTAWIPVVAVSSDSGMEEKALFYGAEDMIVKPITPAVTKLRVANVVKKSF